MTQKYADARSTDSEGIVVFEAGDRKVSNDPNFTGDTGPSNPFRAQAAENQANLEQEDFVPDEVKRAQEANQETLNDYGSMGGKELKALAVKRELSIEGLRKKSELVALLEEADRTAGTMEFTGKDIQDGVSPADQQAEVAARGVGEAVNSDGESRGLSNDSELDEDGEDADSDDDEEDDEA